MPAFLKVALACHYRIAVGNKKTMFGLPEVLLGLLPGLGGTQRLPRTVMLQDALDLMLTGRKISARKAKTIGLIDHIIDAQGWYFLLNFRYRFIFLRMSCLLAETDIATVNNLEKEAISVARYEITGKP